MKSLYQAAVAVALLVSSQSFAQEQSTVTTKVDKPSKFGFKYAAEVIGNELDAALGDKPATVVHYIEPKFKFTSDIYLSVVGRFSSTVGVNGKGADLSPDSYLKFGYPIYKNESGTSVTGQFRYYLPTSKASSDAWLVGVLQPRIYVNQAFGTSGFGLDYVLIPIVYNYNADNGIDNKRYGHGHALEGNYKLSDFWTFAMGFESENYEFEQKPMESGHYFYPGATMNFSDSASLTLQWYQDLVQNRIGASFAYGYFSYTFL